MLRLLLRPVYERRTWVELRTLDNASLPERNLLPEIWIWMDTVLKGLGRQEMRKVGKIVDSFVQPLGH